VVIALESLSASSRLIHRLREDSPRKAPTFLSTFRTTVTWAQQQWCDSTWPTQFFEQLKMEGRCLELPTVACPQRSGPTVLCRKWQLDLNRRCEVGKLMGCYPTRPFTRETAIFLLSYVQDWQFFYSWSQSFVRRGLVNRNERHFNNSGIEKRFWESPTASWPTREVSLMYRLVVRN